jgi:hypothetical protein
MKDVGSEAVLPILEATLFNLEPSPKIRQVFADALGPIGSLEARSRAEFVKHVALAIDDIQSRPWLGRNTALTNVYPPESARRRPQPAPGCPAFGEESVLDRGPKGKPPPPASVHGRIVGATAEEMSAAIATIGRVREHPILRRAASASNGGLRRETPVMLTLEDGSLVEGVIVTAQKYILGETVHH